MVASSVSPQLSYYDKCFLSRWGEKTRLVARHKSSFNRDNTQPIRLKMQRKHKETILAMFCIYSERLRLWRERTQAHTSLLCHSLSSLSLECSHAALHHHLIRAQSISLEMVLQASSPQEDSSDNIEWIMLTQFICPRAHMHMNILCVHEQVLIQKSISDSQMTQAQPLSLRCTPNTRCMNLPV